MSEPVVYSRLTVDLPLILDADPPPATGHVAQVPMRCPYLPRLLAEKAPRRGHEIRQLAVRYEATVLVAAINEWL